MGNAPYIVLCELNIIHIRQYTKWSFILKFIIYLTVVCQTSGVSSQLQCTVMFSSPAQIKIKCSRIERKKRESLLDFTFLQINHIMRTRPTYAGLCDVAVHTAAPPQHPGAAVHSPHWGHLGATLFLSPSKHVEGINKTPLFSLWNVENKTFFLCDPTAEHFHFPCCVFKLLCFTTQQSKTLLKIFVCVSFWVFFFYWCAPETGSKRSSLTVVNITLV